MDLDAYRRIHKKMRTAKRNGCLCPVLDVKTQVPEDVLNQYGAAWIGQEVSAPYHPPKCGVALSYEIGKRLSGVWLEVQFKQPWNGATHGRFFKNFWEHHE